MGPEHKTYKDPTGILESQQLEGLWPKFRQNPELSGASHLNLVFMTWFRIIVRLHAQEKVLAPRYGSCRRWLYLDPKRTSAGFYPSLVNVPKSKEDRYMDSHCWETGRINTIHR